MAFLGATSILCSAASFAADPPRFDLLPDALDPQPCGGAGCWSNHLRVTDINGDGKLDIVIANYADFFNGNNSPQPLVIYTNDGNATFTNVSTAAVADYNGNLRQIAIGDVTGDGSPDIYGPSGAGLAHVLFINDGNGVFTDEAATRLPTSYPAGAAARMGDVDNDGDLDIFAADSYAETGPPFGHIYRNGGTGTFDEVAGAIPGSISGADICDVELFDADGDFDLDLVVNAHSGGTGALWLNDGHGKFSAGGTLAPPGGVANHYNVTPCDVDGDGDLDLWIDNIGGSFTEQLQINDGTGGFTDETSSRVTANPTGADDNGVICADVDNDGDFDAVVVSLAGPERLLQNDGAGNFLYVAGVFPPPGDCSLWGEFGDLDGDGRFDLVTGQGECSSSNEVYLGNNLVPQDNRAPVIRAVANLGSVDAGKVGVVRFAVSDRTVTDEGPRLAGAYAVVDPHGLALESPAKFMGGDLFRALLPAETSGTVTYKVCAQDRGLIVGCSGDFTYEINVPIFVDGFESGNTSAWSSAVP